MSERKAGNGQGCASWVTTLPPQGDHSVRCGSTDSVNSVGSSQGAPSLVGSSQGAPSLVGGCQGGPPLSPAGPPLTAGREPELVEEAGETSRLAETLSEVCLGVIGRFS